MNARRRGALALALAVAAGGCGGHGRPAPHTRTPTPGATEHAGGDRPSSPAQQIQALLDRRAAAVERGDAAAYARTATGSRRAADRRLGADAARLGVHGVRVVVRDARVDGDRARVRVFETYGVRGVRGRFGTPRRLVARRTARGWRLAGVQGHRGRPPWEMAAYRRRDERHFVVLVPPGLDVAAADLPGALADGYARFAAALPHARLRRRYLVVVAAGGPAGRALTQDIRGVGSLAAVSDTGVREAGPARRVTRVLSQRLLVVWPAFSALGADERRRVVAHELTHLVLAGSTSGRTPSWLVEGIALYVSGDRRDEQARAVLTGAAGAEGAAARPAFSLRRLSTPDAIAHLHGAEQAGAYAYASAAAFALADSYGRRALLRLYDAFSDPSLRGPPGPRLVDRALRRVTGESLAAFERRLRAGLS
jgi:hypothetical protein